MNSIVKNAREGGEMISVPSGHYFKNTPATKTAQLTPLKMDTYERAKAEMMLLEDNRRKRTDRLDPIPIGSNDSRKYF